MPIKSTIAKLKKHCLVASALSVKPEWGADTYRVYAQKYNISHQDVEDYACFVTGIAKTVVIVSAAFAAGMLIAKNKLPIGEK